MAVVLTEDLNKLNVSSAYNPDYTRTKFMGTVETDKYGDFPWIDPLDSRIQSIISGPYMYAKVIYSGETITSISHKYYNTTTLWWLILMVNGYLHPHEIPTGARLKIPDINYIRRQLQNAVPVNKGRIVRI